MFKDRDRVSCRGRAGAYARTSVSVILGLGRGQD